MEYAGRRAGAPTVALLGQSGVGKSTLVNLLSGGSTMATQEVRSDGRGRHTTTHRQLVTLPAGGLLIDTPGLRSLLLWDADEGLELAFSDITDLASDCRFRDCAHGGEPGCAVTSAVENGTLAAERLVSWHNLHDELDQLAARQDKRVAAEQKRQVKASTRAYEKRQRGR